MNKAAIISRLEQQCSSALLTLLDDMFASCDDLFFDLASRATSNTEQNLYFESMREVRVRKANSRITYQQAIAALFKQAGQLQDAHKPAAAPGEDLSIVDEDVVELDVAISAMSTRARAVSKSALHELSSRLGVLYETTIGEQDTPLDPLLLSQSFSTAIESGSTIKSQVDAPDTYGIRRSAREQPASWMGSGVPMRKPWRGLPTRG